MAVVLDDEREAGCKIWIAQSRSIGAKKIEVRVCEFRRRCYDVALATNCVEVASFIKGCSISFQFVTGHKGQQIESTKVHTPVE